MPQPKPPATEFDGVWREPPPPGAKPGPTATFTFAADAVVVDLYGQAFRGSFTTERRWPFSVITLDVATREGKRLRVSGIYHLDKDTLCLRIGPGTVADVGEDDRLRIDPVINARPAPLTLTLEKVKK